MGTIFLHEIAGTAILLLLGVGVVANVVLTKTKGNGGGWLLISFGWGLGVFAGVYVAAATGAHLNPAVTVGLLVSGAEEYAPGIAVTLGTTLAYFAAQLIGAFLGAALAWLAYRDHYQAETDQGAILGTFATGPEIRNPLWNMVTEVIATFVLVFVVLLFGSTPSGLGPLAVALLVVAIGASLGGPTGTPSTRRATWAPACSTPSRRSGTRAARTGATPGCRSSARSSAPSWPASPRLCSSERSARPTPAGTFPCGNVPATPTPP